MQSLVTGGCNLWDNHTDFSFFTASPHPKSGPEFPQLLPSAVARDKLLAQASATSQPTLHLQPDEPARTLLSCLSSSTSTDHAPQYNA